MRNKKEDAMRTLTTIFGTIAGLIPAATAFAASGAREDNSGIFVTIFFCVCGLIVIGQLVPVVMVMLGFAKGLGRTKDARSESA
jgi:hypothetical protein